ncbi:CoaA Panthothenate kinase [Caulobacteraceae bacterium]
MSLAGLAQRIADRASPGEVLVVGVTGSVAAGKSTLCAALKGALEPDLQVEVISTDGFLFSNAVLSERGVLMRKGYPETYDVEGLAAALEGVRAGPVTVPGYSHVIYDIDPALSRDVAAPDILIVEGLGLTPRPAVLDLLVYIDADEAHLEDWFAARFMDFWRAAETDPTSFYARFRAMTAPEAEAFARSMVWTQMNLPNLREHIIKARDEADIVVRKQADHSLMLA